MAHELTARKYPRFSDRQDDLLDLVEDIRAFRHCRDRMWEHLNDAFDRGRAERPHIAAVSHMFTAGMPSSFDPHVIMRPDSDVALRNLVSENYDLLQRAEIARATIAVDEAITNQMFPDMIEWKYRLRSGVGRFFGAELAGRDLEVERCLLAWRKAQCLSALIDPDRRPSVSAIAGDNATAVAFRERAGLATDTAGQIADVAEPVDSLPIAIGMIPGRDGVFRIEDLAIAMSTFDALVRGPAPYGLDFSGADRVEPDVLHYLGTKRPPEDFIVIGHSARDIGRSPQLRGFRYAAYVDDLPLIRPDAPTDSIACGRSSSVMSTANEAPAGNTPDPA